MQYLGYHEWLVIAIAALILLVIGIVCFSCFCSFRRRKLCSCFRKKKLNITENLPVGGGASSETHTIEMQGGTQMAEVNVIISLQDLRSATNNFSGENVIGKGGSAVVYKGVYNGIPVAVKRMVSHGGEITSEHQVKQFESEIVSLSKVRHRNLVSMLGYHISEDERVLVLEFMPNGTLANRLRKWQQDGLEPLVWKERLSIALDVARGVEYLHSLAKDIFIHRDLKSSNILLANDLTAKVADFGLMRRVLEGQTSINTTWGGTFGYIAPELSGYRLTTKADVYSFGVVLLELITAWRPMDESKSDDSCHLATWFCDNHLNEEKDLLIPAIDQAIQLDEETVASIQSVAELAGYCCRREPSQRPNMYHAVTVLSKLLKEWSPSDDSPEGTTGIDSHEGTSTPAYDIDSQEGTSTSAYGIDLGVPLKEQTLKWQAREGANQIGSSSSL